MAAPAGVVFRRDEPTGRHVPLRLGGPADAWLVVHRREALAGALELCREQSWKVTPLGAGTRHWVRAGGISGALLRLGTGFASIFGEGDRWEVGAAVPVPALVVAAAKAGRAGLTELARVPGSFGAALKHDAGPWDELVEGVTVFNRGKEREVALDDARRGRSIITGARLKLDRGDPEELRLALRASLAGRRDGDRPVPGCWWHPLPKRSLRSALIRARLGGVRLRGIAIPESAPETFANLGGGTAADLALLQRSAVDRVKREIGDTPALRITPIGLSRRP